ncbi:MAG: glucose 1-dehydrogenase [Ilumatobacter sp.]|jgi:3alpha(or 20beta)-hydroxysteroid dehydrogenase|uniref:SDR family NAD(P)-dependent oxidoreductase n=1 Tax=Ilumatobacter sp. TaxID=1967498 RepID=UPI003F6A96C6|nr:glucose 1-dehydrogenase [Ilumatobacter sp.]MDG1695092.1 glucose 1-dehydrogenase [Ilumatobacter sp.]MDG2438009.1 glucose 1-dehydrogenase [Ilumatobacter sp.]
MTNGRIAGKIALITGGARGQGRQEAERFAAEGATVYITDVLDDVGAAAADELGDAVTFLHHDVTRENDWNAVIAGIVEQHGRIDILVNNAGIFSMTPALDTSIEAWDQMVSINQTGVFLGIRDVGRVMCEQGAGSIINISSIAGLAGVGGAHAYAATKWAVRGMSKSAALEFAAHGVRVNSVHPGIIDTDMLRGFGGNLERVTAAIPMNRTASADEVANVVLFLASEEASYCSGHEFVVDGAMKA